MLFESSLRVLKICDNISSVANILFSKIIIKIHFVRITHPLRVCTKQKQDKLQNYDFQFISNEIVNRSQIIKIELHT